MIRRQVMCLAAGLVLAALLGFGFRAEGLTLLGCLALAAVPLLMLALPAALMLAATLRHGDPYDVLYRYE